MRYPFTYRILALVGASLSLIVGVSVFAERSADDRRFTDVPPDAFFGASVEDMARLGILRGYDDGRFGPNDPVTRGQVAVMIARYDEQVVEPLRRAIADLRAKAGLGSCGDRAVQSGEQCDDGNLADGDGCSRECLSETPRPSHGLGTRRCVSPADCQNGQVCSTAYGDCQSACLPGASACIQVCTGVCMDPRGTDGQSCAPIICADRSMHPTCTESGHPINYFADPCLGRGGATSGKQSSIGVSTSSRQSAVSSVRAAESTCEAERREFSLLSRESKACVMESDCVLYEQSCPYVTCGEAVNKAALRHLEAQAQKVLIACEEEGQPVQCASCQAQTVSCVRGACVASPR